MPAVLTLTFNPALDTTTRVERVIPTHKLRCDNALVHPGGGGINVARVLGRLGASCLALFPAGGVRGALLCKLLDAEGLPYHAIPIAAETRENFAAYEGKTGLDYRFVLPGAALTPDELEACIGYLTTCTPQFTVFSGSLPPGLSPALHADCIARARRCGSKVVLDTSGPALAPALAAGVYLAKPSRRELEELCGQPLPNHAACIKAARTLITTNQAEVVALTLGEEGALLITRDQALFAAALAVKVKSTIGAGDSFVAGMVWGLQQNLPLEECFRYAMASSAAAVIHVGTALAEKEDVLRLQSQVEVSRID